MNMERKGCQIYASLLIGITDCMSGNQGDTKKRIVCYGLWRIGDESVYLGGVTAKSFTMSCKQPLPFPFGANPAVGIK